MVDGVKAYRVVTDVRYAYNGSVYRIGDVMEIATEDLQGFDPRDLEEIEISTITPPIEETTPTTTTTTTRRGRKKTQR